jgi:hypothetical protein
MGHFCNQIANFVLLWAIVTFAQLIDYPKLAPCACSRAGASPHSLPPSGVVGKKIVPSEVLREDRAGLSAMVGP